MNNLIKVTKKLDEKGYFHFADQIEKMIRNAGSSVFDAATSEEIPPGTSPGEIIISNHSSQDLFDYLTNFYAGLEKEVKILENALKQCDENDEEAIKKIQDAANKKLMSLGLGTFLNELQEVFFNFINERLIHNNKFSVMAARTFFDLWILYAKIYNRLIEITNNPLWKKMTEIGKSTYIQKLFYDKKLYPSLLTSIIVPYKELTSIIEENNFTISPYLALSIMKGDDLLSIHQIALHEYRDMWIKKHLDDTEKNDREQLVELIKKQYPELSDKNSVVSFIKNQIKQLYETGVHSDYNIDKLLRYASLIVEKNEFADIFMLIHDLFHDEYEYTILKHIPEDIAMDIAVKIKESNKYDLLVVKRVLNSFHSKENLYKLDEIFADEIELIQSEINNYLDEIEDIDSLQDYPTQYIMLLYKGFVRSQNAIRLIKKLEDDFHWSADSFERPEMIPELEGIINQMISKKQEDSKNMIPKAISAGIIKVKVLKDLLKTIPLIYEEGARMGLNKNIIDEFASKIPVYLINMNMWATMTNSSSFSFLGVNMSNKNGAFVRQGGVDHRGNPMPLIILNQSDFSDPFSVENKLVKNIGLEDNVYQLMTLTHEAIHWMVDILTRDNIPFYETNDKKDDPMKTMYAPTETFAYGIGNVTTLYNSLVKALRDNISSPSVQKIIEEASYSLVSSLPESEMYGIDTLDEMREKKETLELRMGKTIEDYIIKRVNRQKRSIINHIEKLHQSQKPLKLKQHQKEINRLKQEVEASDGSTKQKIEGLIREKIKEMEIIARESIVGDIKDIAKTITIEFMKNFFKTAAKQFGGDVSEAFKYAEWLVENTIGKSGEDYDKEEDDRPPSPRPLTVTMPIGPYVKKEEELPGYDYYKNLPPYEEE